MVLCVAFIALPFSKIKITPSIKSKKKKELKLLKKPQFVAQLVKKWLLLGHLIRMIRHEQAPVIRIHAQ
ncbi:hypothetical protein JP0065_11600 [Helicobacter pylori]|nr:hypothetical protein JSHR3_07790 [Helicobacter pylori]GHQ36958.1 hypothetical protein JP0065_11600 [Helicobacter pylori]